MTTLKSLVAEVAKLRLCLLTTQEHVQQLLSDANDKKASRRNVKVEVHPIRRRPISPPTSEEDCSESDSSSEDESKAYTEEENTEVARLQAGLLRCIIVKSSGKERSNRLLAAKKFIRRLERGKEDKPYRQKRGASVHPAPEDIE